MVERRNLQRGRDQAAQCTPIAGASSCLGTVASVKLSISIHQTHPSSRTQAHQITFMLLQFACHMLSFSNTAKRCSDVSPISLHQKGLWPAEGEFPAKLGEPMQALCQVLMSHVPFEKKNVPKRVALWFRDVCSLESYGMLRLATPSGLVGLQLPRALRQHPQVATCAPTTPNTPTTPNAPNVPMDD